MESPITTRGLHIPIETLCRVPCPVKVVRKRGRVLLVETKPYLQGRKSYDPLDRREPKCWEAVDALSDDPVPEHFAAFASEWGFLVSSEQPGSPFEPRPSPKRGQAIQRGKAIYAAQDVRLWRRPEVLPPLRLAVALFRAITTGRWGAIKNFEVTRFLKEGSYHIEARVPGGKLQRAWFHDRELRVGMPMARTLVEALAERGLRETRLMWNSDSGIYGVADTPLACAWVQLLQDMAEQDGGECKQCGKWILWNRRNPRNKRFCSNTCTVRAFREKHRQKNKKE